MKIAVWTAVAGLLFLASAGRATEPVASERTEAADAAPVVPALATDATAAPDAQGMRAYIDPVTGELADGPIMPEQRAQEEALALPAPDYSTVTFETRADGTIIAHGNGQFESTSTIHLDADGNTRFGCTQTGPHDDHGHTAAPDKQP